MFYRNFMRLLPETSEKSISLVSMRISWPSVSSTLRVSFVPEREKSVNTIINELLIMEARTLLSSTKSTVGDIASQLGFSDAAGFCKFFKRNMGQTPLNYRKGLWI